MIILPIEIIFFFNNYPKLENTKKILKIDLFIYLYNFLDVHFFYNLDENINNDNYT